MTYNMTGIDNGTNILQWVITINSWFDGTFIIILLLEIFIITLIASSKVDFKISMVVASSLTTITGILFSYLEWCKWETIAVPIVLLIVSLIIMGWGENY